jgi:hypothetical protein
MRQRFTLKHQLPLESLQFTNNEFETSITGWDQINNGSEQSFVWNNPSSIIADGTVGNLASTAAVGQLCPFEPDTGWPPGTYTIAITATNTSTGGSAPLVSQLDIYGSDTGGSLNDAIFYLGDDGEWAVGAGEITRQVVFTTTQHYQKLFFKFTKQGANAGYEVIFTIDSIELIRLNGATNDHEISEPEGWNGAKIILDRDPEFCNLVERYEGAAGGAFIFYGANDEVDGGINFIKEIEETYGFDSNIEFLSELAPDDVNYETIFEGLLELSGKNEMKDNKMQVPVIRDDFWAKFINRMDTPVNLSDLFDLDGNPVDPVVPITVNLTSQTIRQKYEGVNSELDSQSFAFLQPYVVVYNIPAGDYGQIDFNKDIISEIEEKFNPPRLDNPFLPSPLFTFKYGGDFTMEFQLVLASGIGVYGDEPGEDPPLPGMFFYNGVYYNSTKMPDTDVKVCYMLNNETPVELTQVDSGSDTINSLSTFTTTISGNFIAGDTLRLFLRNDDSVTRQAIVVKPFIKESYLRITHNTVYPDTQAQGYLIHDLIHGVLARIGLGPDPFRSDFLGSTFTNSRQYDEDGCGWMYVLIKGLQLREYSLDEKPFFISFKQIWDGINPILNLGLGYEFSDDSPDHQYIIIGQKADFYEDDISIDFSNVREISSTYDQNMIFKTIKTGYKKWQSEDISGIDDPQTKQTRATRFEKTGKDLTLESDFIAASLAIETTRRKTREKSADYKFDNDNFIIALNQDDVSPDVYQPELDENFDSITGLLNPEGRYNMVLTPLRNFLRWANYIGGCLQSYQTSVYKFVSGEGNYDMVSDYSCSSGQFCQAMSCDPRAENEDISVNDDDFVDGYLHLALLYNITIPMEWEEYKTIRENPKKAIGISQTSTGHIPFKIKRLEYDLVLGQATISAWPKTFLSLTVPEQDFAMSCSNVEIEEASDLDGDLQDVLDFAEENGYTLPSDEVIELLEDLITTLKEIGVWQDLDILYIFSTDGDEDFATLNYIDPARFKASRVNSPTWLPLIGFQGNAVDSYLDTGWIAATDSVHYTLNDACLFAYIHNELDDTSFADVDAGSREGADKWIYFAARTTGEVHAFQINANGTESVGTGVTSKGFFQAQRTASNAQRLWKNGAQVGADNTEPSTAMPGGGRTVTVLALRSSTITGHSKAQMGVYAMGASLAGKEQGLNDAFNTFTDALQLLSGGAFLREDDSGYIAREDDGLIIRET